MDVDVLPGPGEYSLSSFNPTANLGKLSKSVRFTSVKKKSLDPGPGSYAIGSSIGEGKKWCMGSRLQAIGSKGLPTPGPAHYIKHMDYSVASTAPSFSFGYDKKS